MIRYTVGLRAHGHGMTKAVKIEMSSIDDECDVTMRPMPVTLRAVSAHTLGEIRSAGVVRITRAEYEDRPVDPYDSLVEARWALNRCGWDICEG